MRGKNMKGFINNKTFIKPFKGFRLATLVLFFGLVHCSHTYTIESKPSKADILLWSNKTKTHTFVSKSPLALGNENRLSNDSYYMLKFQKEGFKSVEVIVPAIPSSDQTLNISLKAIKLKEYPESFNQIAKDMVLFQSLIFAKEYHKAHDFVEKKDEVYAFLATYQKLKGNLLLIAGRKQAAKNAYSQAKRLLYNNQDEIDKIDNLLKLIK